MDHVSFQLRCGGLDGLAVVTGGDSLWEFVLPV